MGTLILAALAYTVCYLVSLKIWPYTACSKCGGGGRNGGSNRKRWGSCRACGGSGRKWRAGVRLFMPGMIRQ